MIENYFPLDSRATAYRNKLKALIKGSISFYGIRSRRIGLQWKILSDWNARWVVLKENICDCKFQWGPQFSQPCLSSIENCDEFVITSPTCRIKRKDKDLSNFDNSPYCFRITNNRMAWGLRDQKITLLKMQLWLRYTSFFVTWSFKLATATYLVIFSSQSNLS